MTLLYAREKNSETKEYEVINQEDAKVKGWKQYDVEFDMLNNKWYFVGYVPEPPEPTYDEVKAIRANLYATEVDPLTSQIQRLRDEEQTDEIVVEIEALKMERSAKVAEIKENNPYPVIEIREENPYIEESVEDALLG